MGEIVAGSRVMVRLEAEAEDHEWPEGCASFADVFGDADAAEPDDGFEAGTVIRLDEDGAEPIALVVWDGLADCAEDADGDGMPSVWAWRVPLFALMPHGSCRSRFEVLVEPVRQIATAIGTPTNVDPLADLPGLVMMVQAVVQRAESSAIVVADAVAAERMAIGAWLRTSVRSAPFASNIEHGDHIDDDAPPLPSLRMVMLARDEAWRQVETLTAERDRRIDPVEHARAVMNSYVAGVRLFTVLVGARVMSAWMRSSVRAALLTRAGPDVLSEVER